MSALERDLFAHARLFVTALGAAEPKATIPLDRDSLLRRLEGLDEELDLLEREAAGLDPGLHRLPRYLERDFDQLKFEREAVEHVLAGACRSTCCELCATVERKR